MSDRASIALVNMPFGYSKYPSIQLGTLSALLKSHGLGVKTYYLNLLFAHRIGVPLYERLCEKRALFGEWLFSYLLFRDNPKRAEYLATFKPVFEDISRESGHPISYFEEMATRIAPQFLSWAMTAIDWGQYKIVGFTSTFDQNVASLSLAKLINDPYPSVKIVFGGANYDGEMGLEHLRAFPWIDCVVIGEGEEVFPPLVKQILEGREGRFPPGVAYRQDGHVRFEPNPNLFSDFQRMGPPDYDDYYEQLGELEAGPSKGLDRILLYEGSRGCWWGEKHHCTFCGLNAQAMDKGVTPLQNLQCLKWSLYYHIDVSWNILLGFPKETHEDYRKQIALIPSILHLQPPESVGRFWLERFSPYFMRPEKYGLRITGPGSAYEYVYDPNAVDLKKIAYDFEYESTSHVDPGVYEELVQLVHEWQRRHASADKPFLYYSKSMGYVTIYDGRTKGTPSRQRYDWPEAFMIEYCNEAAKSLEQIRDGLKDQGHAAASDPARLLQALAELVEKRLLYEEKGKYFTLALPMNPNL